MSNNSLSVAVDVCSAASRPTWCNAVAAAIFFLLSIISMTGNGLVMLSISLSSHLRIQKGSFFVFNLAVSDFLCSVYVMLPCFVSLSGKGWKMEGAACTIHGVVNFTLLTTSHMSLAAISIDRAISINRPFDYTTLVTSLRVKIVIVYIWVHCICLAFISAFSGGISYSHWELMCSPHWSSENTMYSIAAATLCSGLPTALLLASNTTIVCVIRRSRSVVFQSSSASGNGLQINVNKHRRTLRCLYLLVAVYLFCVPPYFTAKIGSAIIGQTVLAGGFCLLPTSLLFIAPAVNPFIYSILRQDHRKAVLDTLRLIYRYLKDLKVFLFGSP